MRVVMLIWWMVIAIVVKRRRMMRRNLQRLQSRPTEVLQQLLCLVLTAAKTSSVIRSAKVVTTRRKTLSQKESLRRRNLLPRRSQPNLRKALPRLLEKEVKKEHMKRRIVLEASKIIVKRKTLSQMNIRRGGRLLPKRMPPLIPRQILVLLDQIEREVCPKNPTASLRLTLEKTTRKHLHEPRRATEMTKRSYKQFQQMPREIFHQ
mmetsp:Transcript_32922/g.79650  ORF Transcript_32922/g.79650 Transcript_32922/m.79650 type:complete len:206 (-) Transcript_32922:249-866(-)